MTDRDIVHAMYIYGGSFATELAKAWAVADHTNQARIKATWPELWAQYDELARLHQQRSADAEATS